MNGYEFRYLSQEDILSLQIPYLDVVNLVEEVMALHGRGLCQLPPKVHVNTREQSFLNAMPAYVFGEKEIAGMKWVAGYPANRAMGLPVTWGLIVMNDCETGAPTGVMDARWVTAIRTAAVAAITAKYCKPSHTQAMTIIGAGEQGRWNARIMKLVVPELRRIYIGDLYCEAVERYIEKMQPMLPGVEIVPLYNDDARQQAIDHSQILLTATQRGAKPFIYSEMLHKGMLGIPLESTAWEGKTYTRFAERFVCDDWDLVQVYLRDGKYTDGLTGEYELLGRIINNDAIGRANDEEFVISSCHGIAISDIAVGQMVLDLAAKKNVGSMLPLMREDDILCG